MGMYVIMCLLVYLLVEHDGMLQITLLTLGPAPTTSHTGRHAHHAVLNQGPSV